MVDVDFQNAFPSLFFNAIASVLEAKVPELRPWSRWCQGHCGVIFLPSGEKHRARRGTKQGDPLASLQCGCVIADVTAGAIADMKSRKRPGQDLACFGFWFADEGQYECRSSDAGIFLKCLD